MQKTIKRTFFYLTGLFLIGLSLWTWRFFGPVSIDQALWTLSFGSKGVLTADSVYIRRFITWAIIWPINLTLIFLFTECLVSRYFKTNFLRYLPILLFTTGVIYFCCQYDVPQYLRHTPRYLIDHNIVDS